MSDKAKLGFFIIFLIILFFIVPAVFAVLTYCKIIPESTYFSIQGSIFETYKNFFILLPEFGFWIYIIVLAFASYILGVVSYSGINILFGCAAVAALMIPFACHLRYVDEGIGLISGFTLLFPTVVCAAAGFVGYEIHK